MALSAWAVAPGAAAAKGTAEALAYVKARQGLDGGFAEPGAASDTSTTCWAMLAGSAAGEQVLAWSRGGETPLKYLESQSASLVKLSDIELFTLALASAGADPRNFTGKDLVSLIESGVKSDGQIGSTVAEHCRGLLALASAKAKPAAASTTWLLQHQRTDGGWGENDAVLVQDTALAVEALVGLDMAEASVVDPAMKLLRDKIGSDGGYGQKGVSNVDVTSTVVQAICATGQDPASEAWSFHGNSPAAYLQSMQAADGHYQYSKGTESQPAMTTATAVPASAGKPFPLPTQAAAAAPVETKVHDLGTVGAGATPGRQGESSARAQVPLTQEESIVTSNTGGSASTTGGIGGLWLFLIMCAAYIAALAVAALIAAKLYEPRAAIAGAPAVPAPPDDSLPRA